MDEVKNNSWTEFSIVLFLILYLFSVRALSSIPSTFLLLYLLYFFFLLSSSAPLPLLLFNSPLESSYYKHLSSFMALILTFHLFPQLLSHLSINLLLFIASRTKRGSRDCQRAVPARASRPPAPTHVKIHRAAQLTIQGPMPIWPAKAQPGDVRNLQSHTSCEAVTFWTFGVDFAATTSPNSYKMNN